MCTLKSTTGRVKTWDHDVLPRVEAAVPALGGQGLCASLGEYNNDTTKNSTMTILINNKHDIMHHA